LVDDLEESPVLRPLGGSDAVNGQIILPPGAVV
jgi:hypothetical protein